MTAQRREWLVRAAIRSRVSAAAVRLPSPSRASATMRGPTAVFQWRLHAARHRVVHDASMPARFDGTPGLTTVYERGGQYSNGEYRYRSKFTLATSDDVQAVEVRFLAFDVWGEHMQTFRYEEVADMSTGSAKPVTGEWRLFSENDAEKFYASIGYVSRVRLKSGRVVTAQDAPVVEEARKFSAKFSATDLEPPKPTPGR